jgi:hypothetical protein
MHVGSMFNSLPLEERINKMIGYIPNIQKYFVRTSHTKYYITDLFVKAKEDAIDDDAIYNDAIYNDEMYKILGITKQSLYRQIEERFA